MKVFLHGDFISEIDSDLFLDALAKEYAVDKSEFSFVFNKKELNEKRDSELKGFVVSDVFMNEDIIKTMAVQYNIAADDETIEWIDVNNQTVSFSKDEFGALIKAGSQKVKEIYFKYRALKDNLIKEEA